MNARAPSRAWARALRPPRGLKLTRSGAFVCAVALGLGLAAIRTGDNPLFFLWGTLLGAIVLSGLLSEASVGPLEVRLLAAGPLRAQEPARAWLQVTNTSRAWPAFALSWTVTLRDARGRLDARAPYVLRLGKAERLRLPVTFVPRARGPLTVAELEGSTAYPFGLFVKRRPFRPSGEPLGVVRPPRVALSERPLGRQLEALGQGDTRARAGEDFGALRPYRTGDPLRRVLWRRAAAGRPWLVVEHQGERADSVLLWLSLSGERAEAAAQERLLAACGSVAEAWLRRGVAVGLWTHGAALAPAAGAEQAGLILDALARVEAARPLPARRPPGGALVSVAEIARLVEEAP